jgi:hypothetical protein
MHFRAVVGLVISALLIACGRGAPPPPPAEAEQTDLQAQPIQQTSLPAEADLVDPSIPPAVGGQDGWNYQQATAVDLDGDGTPERAVLTARVELYQGRPAWDDGQPWQVYVEEPDSSRTYLYARRLQLGTLTMRAGVADGDRLPSIILLEHLPHRLAVYEATYAGPDSASVVTRFEREVDPTGETASPQLP